MAEEHFTTGSEENKPPAPPAEAITPGSMESGSSNEEKQTQEEREPSRSRENSYWASDYVEILMGLDQIKALGDLLVSEITAVTNFYKDKGYSPFDLDSETLPTIGHLIQEKATRIKYLVEEELRGL